MQTKKRDDVFDKQASRGGGGVAGELRGSCVAGAEICPSPRVGRQRSFRDYVY